MFAHAIGADNRHHYKSVLERIFYLRRQNYFDMLRWSAENGMAGGLSDVHACTREHPAAVELAVLDDSYRFVASLSLTPASMSSQGPIYRTGRDLLQFTGPDARKLLREGDWEVGAILADPDMPDRTVFQAGNLLALAVLEQSVALGFDRFVAICAVECHFRLKRLGWSLSPLSLPNPVGDDDFYAISVEGGPAALARAREKTGTSHDVCMRLPDLGCDGEPLQIEAIGSLLQVMTQSNPEGKADKNRDILSILQDLDRS